MVEHAEKPLGEPPAGRDKLSNPEPDRAKMSAERSAPAPARPKLKVPADQGEFSHHSSNASAPCVAKRSAAHCPCGQYDLEWLGAAHQGP